MRIRAIMILAAVGGCLVVADGQAAGSEGRVTAAENTAHLERMNAADEARYDVLYALETDDKALLASATAALRPLLESEHGFWIAAAVPEAVQMSEANLESLAELEAAVTAADADRLALAAQGLSDTCAACHGAGLGDRLTIAP